MKVLWNWHTIVCDHCSDLNGFVPIAKLKASPINKCCKWQLNTSSRFFLIKWADRGLVVNGRLNIDLFNVSTFKSFTLRLLFFIQILFWIHNMFMILFSVGIFPFSLKHKPEYPYNSIMGKMCSGYGIHHSRTTDKEMSLHIWLIVSILIYIIKTCHISGKARRFLKKLSPNGSGAMFNGHFR